MGMRATGVALAVVGACVALSSLCPVSRAADAAPASETRPPRSCPVGRNPFGSLPGAHLEPTVHVSKDREPVSYVLWRGTAPSFDGLPMSVDVTVPCRGGRRARPSVTMLHGFTDDKTVWEETGKGDTVGSKDRPGSNARWNNIWFASRGYLTLTYTARGWHDSCGPQTPMARCAGHQYWIHLDDKRWEVRDAQWLTAALVQGGSADPRRLAITGGSYGGAPTASAALLDGHVMCGADPVPKALGVDVCQDRGDGALAPWTTPDGRTRLHWAAALPLYTFADLLAVLAPNGRWTDASAPSPTRSTTPIGVPLQSTISGLVLAGKVAGRFAPPGGDPSSDITTTTARLLAGDPFPPADWTVGPVAADYQRTKSPITTAPHGRVPIFWVGGLSDALFPGSEALAMYRHVRAASASYPIKLFLGDIGHDYAAERQDDWDLAKGQMNAFLDHYLHPDRTPAAPSFDVTVSRVRCGPSGSKAPQQVFRARTWSQLSAASLGLRSSRVGHTSTRDTGPSGIATDPISTATLPGPNSYKGCRHRSAGRDPTAATYDFTVGRHPRLEGAAVVGSPSVSLRVRTTGRDTPIAVRVWDVDPSAGSQTLVTRGAYRMVGRTTEATPVAFQLWPTAHRFARGHLLRVEVTGNDAPYLLANNQQAGITVEGLRVDLPVSSNLARGAKAAGADDDTTAPAGSTVAVVSAALLALAVLLWRLVRRRSRPTGV